MESDLIPLSNLNIMFKYAFLCRNVQMFNFKLSLTPFKVNWAAMKKTKEIVFHRPNPRMVLDGPTSPLPEIENVNEIKLLGVTFCDALNFDSNVNFILKLSSQRSYLVKKLRDHGISL